MRGPIPTWRSNTRLPQRRRPPATLSAAGSGANWGRSKGKSLRDETRWGGARHTPGAQSGSALPHGLSAQAARAAPYLGHTNAHHEHPARHDGGRSRDTPPSPPAASLRPRHRVSATAGRSESAGTGRGAGTPPPAPRLSSLKAQGPSARPRRAGPSPPAPSPPVPGGGGERRAAP